MPSAVFLFGTGCGISTMRLIGRVQCEVAHPFRAALLSGEEGSPFTLAVDL